MTHVHPRLVHQFFVSLSKFDTSIEKVLDKTFSILNFDRSQSVLPTYIGIDVAYEHDHELLKSTRHFFQRLRSTHQKHFVRFVTDTFWAMESSNGDIFYCHDEDKDERCDVIWSIKVRDKNQFEVSIIRPPDNRRRELLTDLQANLNKLFTVRDNKNIGNQLQDIVSCFYNNTKNIRSLEFLQEDCHILLTPSHCGKTYRPVILCGLSPSDATRRWRGVKGQIEYQKHMHSDYFKHDFGVGDLLQIPLDLICDNGLEGSKGFDPRTHYDAVELAFSVFDGASIHERTPHDVVIFHTEYNPKTSITTFRYSIDYLSEVL